MSAPSLLVDLFNTYKRPATKAQVLKEDLPDDSYCLVADVLRALALLENRKIAHTAEVTAEYKELAKLAPYCKRKNVADLLLDLIYEHTDYESSKARAGGKVAA